MATDKNFQLTDKDIAWLQAQHSAASTPTAETTTLSALLGSRLLGPVLDRQLAAGTDPKSSPLLSARARLLVTASMRKKIAHGWEKLLAPPRGSGLLHAIHSPVPRPRIVHFESQIRVMLDLLITPRSDVRGIAMANYLLCDSSGPLYSISTPISLGTALAEATTLLDLA